MADLRLVIYPGGAASNPNPNPTTSGTYTSSGTTITASTGTFSTAWTAGTEIVLNGIPFQIASVTNATTLVVTVMPSGICNTAGLIVTCTAGVQFNPLWQSGQGILINSVQYTIASVQSPTQLTLTTTAGIQIGVAFVLTQAVAAAWSVQSLQTGGLVVVSTLNPLPVAMVSSYPINSVPFAQSVNSAANTANTITVPANATKKNYISQLSVSISGAATANTVLVTLTDSTGGILYQFTIPSGAAIGSNYVYNFPMPLVGSINSTDILLIAAAGAGCITTGNISGYTM